MKACTLLLAVMAHAVCAQAAMAQVGAPPDSVEVRGGVDPDRRDDEALAYRYAPVLHFAPQERFFPILPFFSAFLRLSDTTSPWLTPALAGDTATMDSGRDTLILWNALAREYDSLQMRDRDMRRDSALLTVINLDSLDAALKRLPDTAAAGPVLNQVRQAALPARRTAAEQLSQAEWAPKVAALFYRVHHLTIGESRRVWARLRSDFQLWDRLNLPDEIRTAAAEDDTLPKLVSLEYYAYYIRDLGLTGHAQDLEKFFVLIPEDGTPVQIMIGAAHSIVTPNNVVILARQRRQGSLLYTPHALVEFGGHSFSPDVPPLGLFTPGWDINWRASERSWGVRDIQAVLGTGFSGDYKTQYTLPRTDSIGVTLSPLAPGASFADTLHQRPEGERSYALLPIGPYRRLFEALDSTEGSDLERVVRVREAWDSVLGPELERRMGAVRRFPDDSSNGADVYRRLRLWLKTDLAQQAEDSTPDRPRKVSRLKGSGTKMRPWMANEYIQSPEHIMKAWLYRPQDASRKCRLPSFDFSPVHFGDLDNVEIGGRYGVGKKFSHTALLLEFTDAYHCVERGTKLNIPGTLAFGVAFSPFDLNQSAQEVQLRYQQRYFSPQSLTWSLGLSVVARYDSTETAELNADPGRERSRFRVRPALTIMPIGLAAGATMEPNWLNLVLSSIAVRVGPQIDLFHPTRGMAWQIELAVRPNPKFVPRGRRPPSRRQGPATATTAPPSSQPRPSTSP